MLTTIESLRLRCQLDAFDTSQDTLLTALGNLISARFEQDCARTFARSAAATDEFSGDQVWLPLARIPIESITQFDLKLTETDGWELQSDVDYVLVRGQDGMAFGVSLTSALANGIYRLRVTYAGGYVLPGGTVEAGQTALPQEIEDAALQQVAYWFQQRDKLGVITQWDAGQQYRQWSKQDLLPEVAAIVSKHRRLTL